MNSARLFEDEALWQQYIGEVALRRLLPLFLAWVAWWHESGVACPVGARNLEVKTGREVSEWSNDTAGMDSIPMDRRVKGKLGRVVHAVE